MAINVRGPAREIESLMIDEVQIDWLARDTARTLNAATGQYDTVAPTLLYRGRAMIGTSGQESRARSVGAVLMDNTLYTLRIPTSDTPRIRRDARVTVVASVNMDWLVGVVFRITQELVSTYAVTRKFHMELEDRVLD